MTTTPEEQIRKSIALLHEAMDRHQAEIELTMAGIEQLARAFPEMLRREMEAQARLERCIPRSAREGRTPTAMYGKRVA